MRTKGFTLLEVLVALTIAAIVAFLGVPGLAQFAQKQKAASTTQEIFHQVALAREYAITHKTPVSICPSDNGIECGRSWSRGLLIYRDTNGNGIQDSDDDSVIRISNFGKEWKVRWSAFGRKPALTIGPEGYTLHQNGTFYLCSEREPKIGRMIVINKAARARIAPDSDRDGLAEKRDGKNMKC